MVSSPVIYAELRIEVRLVIAFRLTVKLLIIKVEWTIYWLSMKLTAQDLQQVDPRVFDRFKNLVDSANAVDCRDI